MRKLFLKIYDISIEIFCNSNFVIENLKRDFILYLDKRQENDLSNMVSVNIFKEKPPYWKVPPLEASLYTLGAVCYKNKELHYVDYAGKGLMIYNFKDENAELYSEDENLLYEKARLTVLSRVGELLDNRHIHRLHAVAFAKDKKATICLLPMEAGKTTLAINVMKKDSRIKLISEDVCFVDVKNYVYPFMLRIGARDRKFINEIPESFVTKINRSLYGEKFLIDLSYFKDRIGEKNRICNILIGKRVYQEKSEIKKISKIKCFMPFIQSGVFGLGLPQIVELFLRGGILDLLGKIKIVFSRSLLFLIVALRSNAYEMRAGRNPEKNAEALIDFINAN